MLTLDGDMDGSVVSNFLGHHTGIVEKGRQISSRVLLE